MSTKALSVVEAATLPVRTGSRYPKELAKQVEGRSSQALGDAFGLTQFGANLVTLAPGAWSSHRHWHENEDEFAFAVEGEMVLVDDLGRHAFLPGMCAGFKANNGNGHHIVNESNRPAVFLVVGTRASEEVAHYSDVDMHAVKTGGSYRFTHKDGADF